MSGQTPIGWLTRLNHVRIVFPAVPFRPHLDTKAEKLGIAEHTLSG